MTYTILGNGKTGQSCLKYLTKHGLDATLVEQIDQHTINPESTYLVSPGIPYHHPLIQKLNKQSVKLMSDIDLFALKATKPIIGVTGTNGKTTVVNKIVAGLEALNLNVKYGGNCDIDALSLLDDEVEPDVYVLELSSFQLFYSDQLVCDVGVLTNLALDHQDWHLSFEHYLTAKLKLIKAAHKTCLTAELKQYFDADYLIDHTMTIENQNRLFACSAIAALGYEVNDAAQQAINAVVVPHRREVFNHLDVAWMNDSKATNVAATCAMLNELTPCTGTRYLIIGGALKGETDFTSLQNKVFEPNLKVVGYGDACESLKAHFKFSYQHFALKEVINWLMTQVKPGDQVILSPACASFDQFDGFAQRGRFFKQYVTQFETLPL
jgi:UDP-N-acetylmuramoylalanine--D-glutamate ligase